MAEEHGFSCRLNGRLWTEESLRRACHKAQQHVDYAAQNGGLNHRPADTRMWNQLEMYANHRDNLRLLLWRFLRLKAQHTSGDYHG